MNDDRPLSRMRLLRLRRGERMRDVALALGINEGSLSSIETLARKPSVAVGAALAAHYRQPIRALLQPVG